MKKHQARSFLSFCSFVILLLTTSTMHGQNIAYLPGNFDIQIAFGCNCTCFCDSNSMNTNSPVSMFLTANPVSYIAGSAVVPPLGQVVPPHVGEFPPNCLPPDYGGDISTTFGPEGWTATTAKFSVSGSTPWVPANGFNLNSPLEFDSLPYEFVADPLISNPLSGLAGQSPVQSQVDCQAYPWDVNLTLQFQDQQYYYLDQQLVIGLQPTWLSVPINPTLNYMETNSLVTFSLYCTDGGVTNLITSDITYTITAILLTNNIPLTNDQNIGWSGAPDDVFTNWEWPFTFLGATDLTGNIRGAAGSTKAQLTAFGVASVDDQPLLVEADRAYQFNFSYYLYGTYLGTLTNITGVIPPCTNVNIAFYTVNCTNVPEGPNTLCYSTNMGMVDMLGTPNIWPVLPPDPRMSGITIWGQGEGNTFSQNLTGLSVPEHFEFPVLLVNVTSYDFSKWATENLGTNTSYEYFSSPVFSVGEACSAIVDLTNILVMCPTNPAVVRGALSLSGCVDTNYYGGTGALSYLVFPDFNHSGNPGLPYDPITGIADPTVTNESCLLAFNGAAAPGTPVPTSGGGEAAVEFDNPGGFSGPNSFNGSYSMALAGLESEESFWNANDLHLVFGSPVNLTYDIYDTATNLDINCGATFTNDINYCFGLVTLQVTNTFPPPIPTPEIYTQAVLQVSGGGPGYDIGTFTVTNAFNPATALIDTCDVQLFLPQGNYQYVATVYTHGGGILNLGVTNYFTVNCCNTNPCLQVNCPTNITVMSCTNVPVFYYPTATDLCCSNGPVVCSPPSGSFFAPDSTNTVVCWATDTCGNSNYCDFTVTVLKGTNCGPCLQVQATNLTVDSCSNVFVSYPLPVVADPCCGTNWTVQYYPPSGSLFHAEMSSNVVCIVSDGCGNTNYSTFSVTVNCPTNMAPYIGPNFNHQIYVYWYQFNPNYVLQYNTNLATTNWVDVTNAIPVNGEVVTNTTLPAEFYRIYNPNP